MKQHLEIRDLKIATDKQLLEIEKWYFEKYKMKRNYIQADIIASEGKEIPLLTIGQIIMLIDNQCLGGYKIEKKEKNYIIKSEKQEVCSKELIDALWNFFVKVF